MKNYARKQLLESEQFQLKSCKQFDDNSQKAYLGGELTRIPISDLQGEVTEVYPPSSNYQNDKESNITNIQRGPDLRVISEATRVRDLPRVDLTVISNTAKPNYKIEKPININYLRRITYHIIGGVGAGLLSAATLWLSLLLNQQTLQITGIWSITAIISLVIIRFFHFQLSGLKPILSDYGIRKNPVTILVDEGKISIVFLSVCFILSLPITGISALIFVVLNSIIQLCLMVIAQLVIKLNAGQAVSSGTMVREAIIVGTGHRAQEVADMILRSPEMETKVKGFLDFHREGLWRYRDIPLIGHPEKLEDLIATFQLDAIFLAVEEKDIARSYSIMETVEKMGVTVFVMPNVYDSKLTRVRPTYIGDMPTMVYRSDPDSKLPVKLKGFIDRVGALLGLIISFPIMLIVALIIKMTSRGPVFFKQVRSGLNGRPFELYKYRTMVTDAENRKRALMQQNEMSGPVFKIKEDPRVTKIGRLLRKYSIDELPQFINVLWGEMSLVGPRPPLPQEVRRYEPWQHRKLSVKPGLTCLWQVNGRNEIDFEDWMRLDLQYIDNWSLWLDTKIMVKTIPAVMKGSGR